MALAHMLNIGEAELICDMAEVYRIYDIYALPVKMVALFSYGLRADSRIKMKLNGIKYTLSEQLLAVCTDGINMLNYLLSDATEKPESIINQLYGIEKERDIEVFNSAEDYERARSEIIRKE